MALVTIEQATLAASGAAGIFLVASAWALVTSRPRRVALATLGLILVGAVVAYAVLPLR